MRKKRSPWLTGQLIKLICKRDFLKKMAISTKELSDWNKYKKTQNTVNNQIKMHKSKYFREACSDHKNNPSKLWNTINKVCCRKPKSSIITNLEIGDKKLSDGADIAASFNEHFSTIGSKLADSISSNNANLTFLNYLSSRNSIFSLEPTSTAKVLKLLLKLPNQILVVLVVYQAK